MGIYIKRVDMSFDYPLDTKWKGYIRPFDRDFYSCPFCKGTGYAYPIESGRTHRKNTTECKHCDGSGEYWISNDLKMIHEAWEPTEPPSGDGYQAWEDVTEGSPISPVFESKNLLLQFLRQKYPRFTPLKDEKEFVLTQGQIVIL